MKNKTSRFFNIKRVNSIFAVLLISITIVTFFFEENRVAKKELEKSNHENQISIFSFYLNFMQCQSLTCFISNMITTYSGRVWTV